MKKIIAISLLCVLALMLAFMGIHPILFQKQQETTPEILSKSDTSFNNLTVDRYLKYSIEGNWQSLIEILSGEALINAESNINKLQPQNAKLLEHEIINNLLLHEYEIVDSLITTVALTQQGDSFNQTAYRFFMYEDKIFKVDHIKDIVKNESYVSTDQIIEAENAVFNYINAIQNKQWNEAVCYLTGTARNSALRIIDRMPDIPELHFNNIIIETIGCILNTAYVESQYDTKEIKIKLLFILKNIRDNWLIEEIIIVQEWLT